jgi:hypothetical protein
MRREKCQRLCPVAVDHYDRLVQSAYVTRGDESRAGGGAECGVCGSVLLDHPDHPHEACLTVLCDGSVVKL